MAANKIDFNGTLTHYLYSATTPVPDGSARATEVVFFILNYYTDYIALSEVVFEWADSYDTKDWERLRLILAPDLRIDYSKLNGKTWEAMPANEFIVMVSGPEMFGSKLLRTQHLIGASKWEKISNTEFHGIHQMRSRSVRSADVDSGATASETERSTVVEHLYVMVDGQWKLAGIKPSLR